MRAIFTFMILVVLLWGFLMIFDVPGMIYRTLVVKKEHLNKEFEDRHTTDTEELDK